MPSPAELRATAIALATLEAALSPDWEDRRFSWNPAWADQEELLQGRDGSGEEMHVLVRAGDAAINIASPDHGMLEGGFGSTDWARGFFDVEPIPTVGSTVRLHTVDGQWTAWEVTPDGAPAAEEWLSFLTEGPQRYLDFAAGYYEIDVTPDVEKAVTAIFGGAALTRAYAAVLAPENDWDDIVPELEEMGISPGA